MHCSICREEEQTRILVDCRSFWSPNLRKRIQDLNTTASFIRHISPVGLDSIVEEALLAIKAENKDVVESFSPVASSCNEDAPCSIPLESKLSTSTSHADTDVPSHDEISDVCSSSLVSEVSSIHDEIPMPKKRPSLRAAALRSSKPP